MLQSSIRDTFYQANKKCFYRVSWLLYSCFIPRFYTFISIFPDSDGESKDIVNETEPKYSSCSLLDEGDWHEFTTGTIFISIVLYVLFCILIVYIK